MRPPDDCSRVFVGKGFGSLILFMQRNSKMRTSFKAALPATVALIALSAALIGCAETPTETTTTSSVTTQNGEVTGASTTTTTSSVAPDGSTVTSSSTSTSSSM